MDRRPGAGVSAVSALCLRGEGVQVIAGATESGERLLMTRNDQDSRPQPWTIFAPVSEHPDGELVLENEFLADKSTAILPE